ncbi:MAG: DUF2283 domain-containing protein [Candidatus Aureabacteria bacterium]|nr:DUF2283 domain-containing protein [Candidatus Auribacterota bacterium]
MNKGIFQFKKEKPISISFDSVARALYITFSNNPIAKTIEENSSLFIDYDQDGKIVGIEIIRIAEARITKTLNSVLHDAEKNLPNSIKKTIETCLQTA